MTGVLVTGTRSDRCSVRYVECRNGGLRVDNSSCYPDIYPPTMVDFHMGVFEPDPSFALNDTQFINVTVFVTMKAGGTVYTQ